MVWFILYRSLWGYEIRLIGDNPRAAEYAGINITRNTVLVMMLSGALAGLAGMSEIAGVVHRLQDCHFARLRLHRHHHRLAGETQPVGRDPGVDPLRRADPGRARDPARRACRGSFRASFCSCSSPAMCLLRYRIRIVRAAAESVDQWTRLSFCKPGSPAGRCCCLRRIGEIFAERAGRVEPGRGRA